MSLGLLGFHKKVGKCKGVTASALLCDVFRMSLFGEEYLIGVGMNYKQRNNSDTHN